ncbi:MAG: hypothetical protein EPN47_12015 [Acidobacteria bacterium]|nr:MAG: hypothetical protein EPN47_12015 [Acidobacteriota bacterium]
MKIFRCVAFSSLALTLLAVAAVQMLAQTPVKHGENAALRYWSAFAQMQDVALTDAQVEKLNLILEGTAPFVESTYKDLIERNRKALRTMARGTKLPYCDWGIDYQLGPDAPVDYVRKALELGRLNVLYALHLGISDRDAAVQALAAGVRFSHDVANGGTMFSALAAKNLLVAHLRAMAFIVHMTGLSEDDRTTLQDVLAQIGPEGLDWRAAVERELRVFRAPFPTREGVQKLDPQAKEALGRITALYVSALSNPAEVTELEKAIAGAPQPLPKLIPAPSRVVEQKQDLAQELVKARAILKRFASPSR